MTQVPDKGLWLAYIKSGNDYTTYRYAISNMLKPVTREVYAQRRKEYKLKSLLGVKP